MNTITAYSVNKSVDGVVNEIKNKFFGFPANSILFFASSVFDPDNLAKQMQEAFPAIPVFGCTTWGELVDDKCLEESVSAMAFNSEVIGDIQVQVLENISHEVKIKEAFDIFEKHFQTKMSKMEFDEYIGLTMIDGMSKAEEKVMEQIGIYTNVMFLGGSAGNNLKIDKTYVYANGKAYTNAAVIVLIKPAKGYCSLKTQSFKPTGKKLKATKVNLENREVIEFNGQIAKQAYADALGTTVEDSVNYFHSNPIGVIIDEEPYIRGLQKIEGDSLLFYCNVLEGFEYDLLEPTDIVNDTRHAVAEKINELGSVSAVINFNCMSRSIELLKTNKMNEFCSIFKDIPHIGFSTFGEQHIVHINQTSCMLLLK